MTERERAFNKLVDEHLEHYPGKIAKKIFRQIMKQHPPLTSVTTVTFRESPAAAPCAIHNRCMYGE